MRQKLPSHDLMSLTVRIGEAVSILTAWFLVVWHGTRLWGSGSGIRWWPVCLAAGFLLADLVSGLVHWIADTWFSETMPILGRRFLRPFRVHHVNPEDFLHRHFVDCNGDVAMLTIPFLLAVFAVPSGTGALFLWSFCVALLPTNQVHQWAHRPSPPRIVRWLQDYGILLSRAEHLRHHGEPYTVNYCIANGWCNRLLEAIRFFRRMEGLITRCTGLRPRDDDRDFAQRELEV